MQPKRFKTSAERRARAIFGKDSDALLVIDGRTHDGQHLMVYRGHLPGETARAGIGNFAIFSTANTAPRTPMTEQIIAAGSLAVRHPSLDFMGTGRRERTIITTDIGLIGLSSYPDEPHSINGHVLEPIPVSAIENMPPTPTPEPTAALQ
jgi:hypothetical protein